MVQVKIAVIPGDGIGREVIPEGIRVLEAAGRLHGLEFQWTEFDWSCQTYLKTGRMMPADGLDRLKGFEALYLGAVGFPSVPDHISLWGLLIPIRRAFDQYVNLRPVRLFEGVACNYPWHRVGKARRGNYRIFSRSLLPFLLQLLASSRETLPFGTDLFSPGGQFPLP